MRFSRTHSMDIITGIDIVNIERFKKVLETNKEPFLQRVFFEDEYVDMQAEHLAGIFAAKEAAKKAFGITAGDVWQKIEIRKHPSRKPYVVFHMDMECEVINADVSIAHDGGNAVAVFVALINPKQVTK